MRFLHIADLHLGKSLCGQSLLESGDQGQWVEDFLALSDEVKPQAVLIAGDVYDRSSPSGEAVELLDRLVTGLAEQDVSVLLIAGNHDSGKRLAFGGSLLARQKVHVAGVPRRQMQRVVLKDEYGPVTFWLMPYLFAQMAAEILQDEDIRDYDTAVRRMIAQQEIDFSGRNVILAHQNVTLSDGTEAPRGGSETMVGGVGQVGCSAFDGFEYAALGHIHRAYPVGRQEVRFAGSPLCYHFDELGSPKGPVLVELGEKDSPAKIQQIPIPQKHPLRVLRGDFEELRRQELENPRRGEYLRVVLEDRRVDPEIAAFFHELAAQRDSRVLELVSAWDPFSGRAELSDARDIREKPLEELFSDFSRERAGSEPDDEDLKVLRKAAELAAAGEGEDPAPQDVQALLDFVLGESREGNA